MKSIIRRTLIVFWLAAIAGVVIGILNFGLLDSEAYEISVGLSVLIWVLQFVLTGAVNPFVLIRAEVEQSK